jgi:hypothetical protein
VYAFRHLLHAQCSEAAMQGVGAQLTSLHRGAGEAAGGSSGIDLRCVLKQALQSGRHVQRISSAAGGSGLSADLQACRTAAAAAAAAGVP